MKFPTSFLIITSLLVSLALSQSIVDFTYSQYDHREGKEVRPSRITNIKPDKLSIQGYSFPEACYLGKKLEQEKIQDSHDVANYDMDSIIDGLKIDFIELLKVSEKIKKKKSNIQELSKMSERTVNATSIFPKDLDTLRKQQGRLGNINEEIRNKTQQLELLVLDSMMNSDNNEFTLSAVNFQIESLKLKLDYLKNLRKNSNDEQYNKTRGQFDRYFSDLKVKFDEESQLIEDFNTILKGYDEISELNTKITNLKGQIDIANLIIEEKQACAKERDQIKKFQRNDHEIKSLMASLREKKKDKSTINNTFCEGVAKKLEDRVKKVIISYNYTFECAEGLRDMEQQRDNSRANLQKAQARLRELQNGSGIDSLKKLFDLNRQYFKNKQNQLLNFTIPVYTHNAQELDRLILKTHADLDDANSRKSKIGQSSGNKVIDYRKIQDLVTAIKRLKGIYCEQYEKYENRAQQLWKQIQRYEAQIQYNAKIRGIYEEEINQLRDLEASFDILRTKILKKIQ